MLPIQIQQQQNTLIVSWYICVYKKITAGIVRFEENIVIIIRQKLLLAEH